MLECSLYISVDFLWILWCPDTSSKFLNNFKLPQICLMFLYMVTCNVLESQVHSFLVARVPGICSGFTAILTTIKHLRWTDRQTQDQGIPSQYTPRNISSNPWTGKKGLLVSSTVIQAVVLRIGSTGLCFSSPLLQHHLDLQPHVLCFHKVQKSLRVHTQLDLFLWDFLACAKNRCCFLCL